jgi:hypothetical protein
MSQRTVSSQDVEENASQPGARDLELDQIRKAVAGIRFGEVRLIIQDGHVVQIERVEKRRLR